MPSVDEIKRLIGKRVKVRLADALGGPAAVAGRLIGVLDAADGLVVAIQPAEQPERRLTYHYQHIVEIKTEEG